MLFALEVAFGILWTASYLAIIWKGSIDKTYGMPIVAAASNVSWEFIFAFVYRSPQPQETSNIIWFTLDLIILATIIHFGSGEFPGVPRHLFLAALAGIVAMAYSATLLIATDLDKSRPVLTAFGGNLMMSALFLSMLYTRWRNRSSVPNPLRGQSALIALTKLGGTACASIAAYLYFTKPYGNFPLLPFLYISCFILDAIYVAALYAARKHLHQAHNNARARLSPRETPSRK